MPDKFLPIPSANNSIMTSVGNERLVDMGDGTFARVVAISAGASTVSGGVTVPARLAVEPLGAFVASSEATASSAVSAAVAINVATKRISFQAETNGAAVAFGTSGANAQANVADATKRVRVPAGGSRDFQVPTGATHFAWIRTGSADATVSAVELT